ncbi:ABC transporter ATP-binding protein [Ferrimonas marina]|uniref:ABC-2 type transport system ATP-binding protein n=1 Tax=Ferrimonas marina TaxID=299255 RepID=A0A1M5MZ86_9GAMM|nr:ABC transporter ATP-binding protein [Ferrimonas marina]SHG82525.1 ABC-2 type transport system ATP-binding protein [Ferrimonas marina]
MNTAVISAQGLGRRFGEHWAVRQLDLSVQAGMIYGFLGPNGCGKTTTIRMLTGLLTPSAGEVEVLGQALPAGAEPLRQAIGYMTQKFSLYGDLTVAENLRFIGQIYGLSGKGLRQRVTELLSQYYLEAQANQLAGSMSGGQRQRLALAAAVIHRPQLLFLDEPTSAVDPESRRSFWEQLFDLSAEGTTILVSTHYMDEAERCHRLAILEQGQKRIDGEPEQLMGALDGRVVELEGPDLRRCKSTLVALDEVQSAAQQGTRLRVLVQPGLADPTATIKRALPVGYPGQLRLARPSLEDVFVSCTQGGAS